MPHWVNLGRPNTYHTPDKKAIRLKTWDMALENLPVIDVRHTEIQIATQPTHHVMDLIPYVSFDAIAQGIGEGCSQADRLLTREFTKEVILDGLSFFWLVFGLCVAPQDWMPLNENLNEDLNRTVLPPLIRVAVKWREEMDWLEKTAKEKATVDFGACWSNALKVWIAKLDPNCRINGWDALDSETRSRLIIERLDTLRA